MTNANLYRVTFLDYDARRDPKTERYCVMCQRDIKPAAKAREVHVVDGGVSVLHPDDEHLYPDDDPGNCGVQLLGLDCARKLGLEWSRPERDWTKDSARKGYIVLFGGTQTSAAVTILRETAKFYVVRHDVDWADRKAGDERRISKQHVREVSS